jgi:hypothetical protein
MNRHRKAIQKMPSCYENSPDYGGTDPSLREMLVVAGVLSVVGASVWYIASFF